MSDFKWRSFQGDVILGCTRWYCKYGINYRELEEMMLERGFKVDRTRRSICSFVRFSIISRKLKDVCGGSGFLEFISY